MKKHALLLCLLLLAALAHAESRVFTFVSAQPQEVLATVRSLYGDQVRVEVINQRLAVVGSAKQVAEIAQLVEQLDRAPAPLRLTLSEDPPIEEITGTVYRTGAPEYRLETVEGGMVSIEASAIAQRATAAGWTVLIEEVPVTVRALNLLVRLHRNEVVVTYSFARHEGGERRVFGNRRSGDLGRWMPLLPRIPTPVREGSKVYSSEAQRESAQLYLKVERLE